MSGLTKNDKVIENINVAYYCSLLDLGFENASEIALL
jgi:hypothetical protein